MDILYNGRLYLFEDIEDDKYKMYFNDRCWFLAKAKDKCINDDEAYTLSNIYIAMEHLGCRYPYKIETRIRDIINK
tara:strand:+ start:17634 stop:17861 length:228 start_codon:yes stop_codon:yes gene_type:complete